MARPTSASPRFSSGRRWCNSRRHRPYLSATILRDRSCFHKGCIPLGQELLLCLMYDGLVARLARSGSIVSVRPAIILNMILHTNRWMIFPLSNIRLHQVRTLLKSSAVQSLQILIWRCGVWEKVKEYKTQEALQHNNHPPSMKSWREERAIIATSRSHTTINRAVSSVQLPIDVLRQ